MVAEDFLQDPGPAVARWRRADLDAAHLPRFAGRAVAMKRSAASRANSSTAMTRTADRLMTLIWSSALSLFWKALRHTPSALTQPPNVCRLRGTPPQVSTSAAALRTASDGRHGQGVRADWSGASHSRSRTARRERHATETPGQPRQRAGGHAPQPAGPSDAARPNRTLSAAASNAAPTPPRLEVRSHLKSA